MYDRRFARSEGSKFPRTAQSDFSPRGSWILSVFCLFVVVSTLVHCLSILILASSVI
jgi:hypothetical protein